MWYTGKDILNAYSCSNNGCIHARYWVTVLHPNIEIFKCKLILWKQIIGPLSLSHTSRIIGQRQMHALPKIGCFLIYINFVIISTISKPKTLKIHGYLHFKEGTSHSSYNYTNWHEWFLLVNFDHFILTED